jgi:hypothetical protein
MKVFELFLEAVHRRVQANPPAKRGAPEEKARAFDKKKERNRSVLDRMERERNQFFATGDTEYMPPDDEMSWGYKPGFQVLVMSGKPNGELHRDYSGVNVFFPWDGGEPEGHTFDDRADNEWDNPKTRAKIIAVAREQAKEELPKYVGGGIDKMVHIDDDDKSEEAEALRHKLATRAVKKRVKIMLGIE